MSGESRLGISRLDDFTQPAQEVTIERKRSQEELVRYLEEHAYKDGLLMPADEDILFYQGIPIGSRGNILAINGRPKSRKSVIASAIMSSAYCDGFLGFTTRLPGDPKVLNFDTEQGFGHWLRGSMRVLKDAGQPIAPKGFKSHHTRECEVDMQAELFECALDLYKPDIAVLDGVTDLVYDLNNQEEATRLGKKLMHWSVKYNCLIVVIIHITKSTGYMTGAIGTYLEKKCQTAIKTEKDDDNEEVTHVSCQYARDKGFKTFSIIYEEKEEHYVQLAEEFVNKKGKKGNKGPMGYSEEVREKLLSDCFRGPETSFPVEVNFRRKISACFNVLFGETLSKNEISAWLDYWQAEAKIFFHQQYGFILTSTLTQIKKVMPELDLKEPAHPDALPDNVVDDLPF
jgi:hypothetical protein